MTFTTDSRVNGNVWKNFRNDQNANCHHGHGEFWLLLQLSTYEAPSIECRWACISWELCCAGRFEMSFSILNWIETVHDDKIKSRWMPLRICVRGQICFCSWSTLRIEHSYSYQRENGSKSLRIFETQMLTLQCQHFPSDRRWWMLNEDQPNGVVSMCLGKQNINTVVSTFLLHVWEQQRNGKVSVWQERPTSAASIV